jgi:hypothetical protein
MNFLWFSKLANTIILSSFVFVSFIIIYSLDLGFGFTDEGLYYSLAQPDSDQNSSLYNYYLLFRGVQNYFPFYPGFADLRLIRFILLIITGLCLYLILYKKTKLSPYDLLLILISLFAGYAIMPASISYYSLTTIIVLFFVINFRFFYFKTASLQFLGQFLIGIIVSVAYIIKPTTGLILISLSFLLPFFGRLSAHHTIKFILVIFAGLFFSQLLFQQISPFYHFSDVFKNGLEVSNKTSEQYGFMSLLKGFLSIIRWCLVIALSGYVFAYGFERRTDFKYSITAFLISFILLGYFFYAHKRLEEKGVYIYLVSIIPVFFIGQALYLIRHKFSLNQKFLFYFLLLIAPFICHIGSNVYFFRINQHYIIFWVILLLIVGYELNNTTFNRQLQLMKILLGLTVGLNVYIKIIYKEYGLWTPKEQLVKWNYSNGNHLYLQPYYADYFSNLQSKFIQYAKSNPVLGLEVGVQGHSFLGVKDFYNSNIYDKHSLSVFFHKIKADPVYANQKPLIISFFRIDKTYLPSFYKVRLLDSVPNFIGSNTYLYQSL